LRGMPHREEREEAIAKIRMQVSVLLQPQLKHALANMNTRLAPLQQCVLLYSKLDKMDALKAEYIKNRPAAIHKAWFDYRPSYSTPLEGGSIPGSNTKAESASFLSWLPSWFDVVLSLITEERRQSMAIFGAELVSDIMVKVRTYNLLILAVALFSYYLFPSSKIVLLFVAGFSRVFSSHTELI